MKTKTALLIVGILVALGFVGIATRGRISGIVTDSSGEVIVGATVTVTDVYRGLSTPDKFLTTSTYTLHTDSTGQYVASNLTPSRYKVHVTCMGFLPYDRQDITVGSGGDVHVDVTLEPGE